MMIFECFGDSKGLIEFEYIGEEGTGLGPTLEYYSLVIEECMKQSQILWRETSDNTLFPKPLVDQYKSPSKNKKEFSIKNPV